MFRCRSVLWLLFRFTAESSCLGDSKFSKKPCSLISFTGDSSYSLASKLETADDELLSLSSLFEDEDEGVTLPLKTLSSSSTCCCSVYLNELRSEFVL